MKQLISVRSESQTTFARFVSFVVAFVMLLVNLDVVTDARGEQLIGIIQDPQTTALANAIFIIIAAALPSFLGWRNKKKELPSGVTVDDVTVKSSAVDAPSKERKIVDASKASMFIVAIVGFSLLAGCCSKSREQIVVADNRQPIYNPVPPPIPMPPPEYQLDK